ncbi:MAG: 50S ribosomal protein L21 [Deltaproteobacteria bacterium]|nr:MAG: 50S ribosomal protein L21 [Deltaproteobacteria bacterium]
MYAIVEAGGKQYKVAKGDLIKVEKIEGEVGEKVELDKVLLIKAEDGVKLGKPTLAGAKVVGRIKQQGRGEKIVIFKYKRRKNYRRKQGHRQYYTWIEIEDIIS